VSHALYLGSSPEVHMYFLHGVTAGVCRPHQRLMYLEALSVVARESEGGYREVFAMREHSNGSARGGEASCENDETAYGRNG
jgi:hypothetical protein